MCFIFYFSHQQGSSVDQQILVVIHCRKIFEFVWDLNTVIGNQWGNLSLGMFTLCLLNVNYSFFHFSLSLKFIQIKHFFRGINTVLGKGGNLCLKLCPFSSAHDLSHGLPGTASHVTAPASPPSPPHSLFSVSLLRKVWASGKEKIQCCFTFPSVACALLVSVIAAELFHHVNSIKELECSWWSRTWFFIRKRIFLS